MNYASNKIFYSLIELVIIYDNNCGNNIRKKFFIILNIESNIKSNTSYLSEFIKKGFMERAIKKNIFYFFVYIITISYFLIKKLVNFFKILESILNSYQRNYL